MAYADELGSGAPVTVYHVAASGAPVGAEPMALVERPAAPIAPLRAPGYRPVTPPPPLTPAKRGGSRGQPLVVALVALVVALAAVGAVLAGILWR